VSHLLQQKNCNFAIYQSLPDITSSYQAISAVSRLIPPTSMYPGQYQRYFTNKSQNDSSVKLFIAILTIKVAVFQYPNHSPQLDEFAFIHISIQQRAPSALNVPSIRGKNSSASVLVAEMLLKFHITNSVCQPTKIQNSQPVRTTEKAQELPVRLHPISNCQYFNQKYYF